MPFQSTRGLEVKTDDGLPGPANVCDVVFQASPGGFAAPKPGLEAQVTNGQDAHIPY